MDAHIILANRGTDFNNSFIPEFRQYEPPILDPVNKNIRDALYLNDTSTDYYLLTYLSLLNTIDSSQYLNSDIVTNNLSITDYVVQPSIINNAELVLSDTGYPHIGIPSKLPIIFDYFISYKDNNYVTLLTKSYSIDLGYVQEIINGETLLSINFGDLIPLTGKLKVDTWAVTSSIHIQYAPKSFPYLHCLNSINKSNIETLLTHNLWENYLNASSTKEKLAFIVIGLINNTYESFKFRRN